MEIQTLKATVREAQGTGDAQRTRRRGIVPGVVYGGGQKPISLKVDAREFTRITQRKGGEHAVVQATQRERADRRSLGALTEIIELATADRDHGRRVE